MNKQKTDWDLKLKLVREISEAMAYEYSEYDAMSNNDTPEEVAVNLLDKFITKTLQQQREEIIKVIKEHRPLFFKGDLHSLLSQDEVMRVREVLRIEILEELGVDCKEIRERLKQITNLKEK